MLYYVSLAYYNYCYFFFLLWKKSGGGGGACPLASPALINLCTATTMQHWFSKFFKLFENFCEFCVFIFRYRATNENMELEEDRIQVIFHWENLWEGIRIGSGIILRLFYQQRKEIMIFHGFCEVCKFRGIHLAQKVANIW